MPDSITLRVNGTAVTVPEGASVAAAILAAGVTVFRRSVTGQPRGPLCGMGICFECRATIDGTRHQRTCQLPVRSGMEVQTDGSL
jgi:sarcosine oxidase subunit alpha